MIWSGSQIRLEAPVHELTEDYYSTMKFTPWFSHSIIQHAKPHYWYAVLVNCNGARASHEMPVHYDAEFLNEANEGGGDHFSADEGSMLRFSILVFVAMNVVGVFIVKRLQYHFKRRKPYFHVVIVVLVASLTLQYPSLLLRLIHFMVR